MIARRCQWTGGPDVDQGCEWTLLDSRNLSPPVRTAHRGLFFWVTTQVGRPFRRLLTAARPCRVIGSTETWCRAPRSATFQCHLPLEVRLSFGIDLCRFDAAMIEHGLGMFDTKSSSDFGCPVVS